MGLGNPLGNPLVLPRSTGTGSSIGDIVTRLAPPSGQFLEADGRQLSKAMYPKLFAAIGDAYSVADFSAGFTAVTLSASSTWISIAYGNGLFVAISAAGLTSVSADGGLTWQAGGTLSLGGATPKAIAFGAGVFVVVFAGISNTNAMTSADGGTWSPRSLPTTAQWLAITYGGGKFVALGFGAWVALSTDGITWTSAVNQEARTWSSVTYGNGMYVAVASGIGTCESSPNGTNWTIRALPSSAAWSSVAYGNGVFVAVANGSASTAVSGNGINWSLGAASGSGAWTAVAFGAGFFYATSAAFMTSKDGFIWDGLGASLMPGTSAIAFGAGVFISVISGSSSAMRRGVYSPITFNLPKTTPLDNRSTAYIKVA